jgi:hypothetical protein
MCSAIAASCVLDLHSRRKHFKLTHYPKQRSLLSAPAFLYAYEFRLGREFEVGPMPDHATVAVPSERHPSPAERDWTQNVLEPALAKAP